MIVALLNQKGGVGKTTLALQLAGAWAAQGTRVLVVDADPQGSALDWSEQRGREGLPRLFGVLGLARETLHRELPEIARDADHVVERVAFADAARTGRLVSELDAISTAAREIDALAAEVAGLVP